MNEENNFNTVGEPSTIDTPVTPVQEPVINNNVNNTPKKGNNLKLVVVILIILLLGAIGYILYTKGVFGGEKKDNTKTEEKEETKEQLIKVNLTKFVDLETHTVGTIKVAGKEYEVKYQQDDCQSGECSNLTRVLIGAKEFKLYESGLSYIAVLDDNYILVKGYYIDLDNTAEGEGQILIIDKNLNDVTTSLGIVVDQEIWYNKMDSNYNITNESIKLDDIGYVDANHIKTGECVLGANSGISGHPDYQEYKEYLITFKDGKVSSEIIKNESPVFCSAQMR